MTTLRVHRVQFLADKTLRVHGVQFTGPTAAVPTLRVHRVQFIGTPATTSLRVHGVQFIGSAPVALLPLPDRTAEAFDQVVVTAQVAPTSPTPSGFVWRQIPSKDLNGVDVPTVTFQDNGNSITVNAPPLLPGGNVLFGVTALLGASSSPEVVQKVAMVPHLNWTLGSDGVWKPMMRIQTL